MLERHKVRNRRRLRPTDPRARCDHLPLVSPTPHTTTTFTRPAHFAPPLSSPRSYPPAHINSPPQPLLLASVDFPRCPPSRSSTHSTTPRRAAIDVDTSIDILAEFPHCGQRRPVAFSEDPNLRSTFSNAQRLSPRAVPGLAPPPPRRAIPFFNAQICRLYSRRGSSTAARHARAPRSLTPHCPAGSAPAGWCSAVSRHAPRHVAPPRWAQHCPRSGLNASFSSWSAHHGVAESKPRSRQRAARAGLREWSALHGAVGDSGARCTGRVGAAGAV